MTSAAAEPRLTTDDTDAPDEVRLNAGQVAKIWARHLVSLLFPLNALVYLWTGPHPWYIAPLFVIPIGFAYALDTRKDFERRQPTDALPKWPFDALVYLLAALQFLVIIELARMFAVQQVFSIDMLLVFLIVGGSSGFSIITAHELIHRSPKWEQWTGRLLLCTVLYEHFYTEHLRGHHVRVGTSEDPATAEFGETYEGFFRRTVPAQFKSAWRLEAKRLGDEQMSLFDPRMLRNRILHGIAVGWGMAFAIYATWGAASVVAFLIQAFFAIRLLEAVNYFEHWGLKRAKRRVRPVDSWDTHSWFTYYGLVGLSRHADHHAYPKRPYQQLRVWEEAPMLPVGYVGMVDMVMGKNDEFRQVATEELRTRQLGPFVDGQTPPEIGEPSAFRGNRERLGARLAGLPVWLQVGAPALLLVLLATLGGYWESGAAGQSFAERLLLNGWIAVAFVAFFACHALLQRRTERDGLSWLAAFGLLLTLGGLTSWWM